MRYRMGQIRLDIEEIKGRAGLFLSLSSYESPSQLAQSEDQLLRSAIVRDLKKKHNLNRHSISEKDICPIEIIKKSLDARKKKDIHYVYSVDFETQLDLDLKESQGRQYVLPERGDQDKGTRPVIVGMGPCGIFAGLILAQAGYDPIIIERGQAVEDRSKKISQFWNEQKLDPESNPLFGEGGAGTFSDGKLTTGVKDPRIFKVLSSLVQAGAKEEILYLNKPHIGTDAFRGILKKLRRELLKLGAEIHFNSRLTGINLDSAGAVKGIEINGDRTIQTDRLVMATGHSARDVFELLNSLGADMEQKPFSIGARIIHPQAMVDRAQYGDAKLAKILGAAEYKLSGRARSGRGVYSFCMCPGGQVIMAASEEGGFTSNGMSNSRRDGQYANSALLVDVRTEDFASSHVLAGVDFQRKYERLAYQLASGYHFLESDWDGLESSKLARALPEYASQGMAQMRDEFERKLEGFGGEQARFAGPETRSSSPVRILRDRVSLQSNIKGLYPAGEGAGYAGGIMSAALDGIRVAETIIKG